MLILLRSVRGSSEAWHRLVSGVWVVAVFVAACVPVWVTISKGVSTPFDEAAHFDYVDKLAHGELPQVHEKYGERTLDMVLCHSTEAGYSLDSLKAWVGVGACGEGPYLSEMAPFKGQNYVAAYSPAYYMAVAVPYAVILGLSKIVGSTPNDLIAMRYASSLLAGIAAVLIFIACRKLGLRRFFSATLGLAFVTAPALTIQFATINSDAGAQVAVAGMFLVAVVLFERTRRSGWGLTPWRLLVSGLALGLIASTKETTLIAVPPIVWIICRKSSVRINLGSLRFRLIPAWILLGAEVLVLAGLFRLGRPILSGTAGPDYMAEYLRSITTNELRIYVITAQESINAYAQVVWSGLIGQWSELTTSVVRLLVPAGLVGALLYSSSNERDQRCVGGENNGESTSEIQRGSVMAQSYTIGIVALPVGAVCLSLLAWVLTGAPGPQPRYYIAASSLLIILGGAIIGDRQNRLAFVWLLPWILTLVTLLYRV